MADDDDGGRCEIAIKPHTNVTYYNQYATQTLTVYTRVYEKCRANCSTKNQEVGLYVCRPFGP